MSTPNVRLMALTEAEVAACLDRTLPSVPHEIPWAEPDLVPDVVAKQVLERARRGEDWFWCAPRLFYGTELGLMVGSGAFKNSPTNGRVEIGYGVATAHRGHGYAVAGTALLCAEAFHRPDVAAVTAETSQVNPASERVLLKNAFQKIGTRVDSEDGVLNCWELLRDNRRDA